MNDTLNLGIYFLGRNGMTYTYQTIIHLSSAPKYILDTQTNKIIH